MKSYLGKKYGNLLHPISAVILTLGLASCLWWIHSERINAAVFLVSGYFLLVVDFGPAQMQFMCNILSSCGWSDTVALKTSSHFLIKILCTQLFHKIKIRQLMYYFMKTTQ